MLTILVPPIFQLSRYPALQSWAMRAVLTPSTRAASAAVTEGTCARDASTASVTMQPFICRPNRPRKAWQRYEERSLLSITQRMRSDSFAKIEEFAKLTNHSLGQIDRSGRL